MKKLFILSLVCGIVLSSCSKDSEAVQAAQDSSNYSASKESESRAADYTSDPKFLTMVNNYSSLAIKTVNSADEYDEPASSLSSKVVLQMAGFSKQEEFREFQSENTNLYYKIADEYDLKTEAQLQELSESLKEATKDKVQAQVSRMGVCGWNLVFCMVDVLVEFSEGVSEIGGVGCVWNPGSDCWEAMLALEAQALWDMQGCVDSYLGC